MISDRIVNEKVKTKMDPEFDKSFMKQACKIILENSKFISPDPAVRFFEYENPAREHISGTVKAVLFDIYGTLFVSAAGDISHGSRPVNGVGGTDLDRFVALAGFPFGGNGLKKYLKEEIIKEQNLQKGRIGTLYPEVKIQKVWINLMERFGLSADNENEVKLSALRYEMIVNPVWPMPAIEEVVAIVSRKVETGIISNAQFFTPYLFDAFTGKRYEDLGIHKDLTFLSCDYGVSKPDDLLFREASRRLFRRGISPRETLYVGNDMLNDVYGAHKNGMQTCLFAGDARSLRLRRDHPLAGNLHPDYVITSLHQLLKIL